MLLTNASGPPTIPMTDGDGYWLNPANGASVQVVRHELTMHDRVALEGLGVAAEVIAEAQGISPYSPDGEQALRMLGVNSGLVRIRDHQELITVQFSAMPETEPAVLVFVREFLEGVHLWRPWIKVGNFGTGEQAIVSWEEFVDRSTKG